MRNRQRCEENRFNRLIHRTQVIFTVIDTGVRSMLLNRMRESDDYKRSTRVTRTKIDLFIEVWEAQEDARLEG